MRIRHVGGTLKGEKIFMAHSLGNMVVSNLIQNTNIKIDKYFMLNAAIPSEAFSGALQNISPKNTMLVPKRWQAYPTASWASQWHTHFTSKSDDRGKLTWRNQFSNVPSRTQVYNYYSSGDEVFELDNETLGLLRCLNVSTSRVLISASAV